MPIAVMAERVLTPVREIRDAVILVDGEAISRIGARSDVRVPAGSREIHAPAGLVVPGFIDVHINGAGGHDAAEATPEAILAISKTVARFGTTSFLATVITAPPAQMLESLRGISSCLRNHFRTGSNGSQAEPLGLHIEGPFINKAKRGVHPAEWVAAPSLKLFDSLLEAVGSSFRRLTLAPELPGSDELIAEGLRRDLVLSLGHSNATFTEAVAAIDRGAHSAVHVFNAMRPFSHRDPGIVGAVLTDSRIMAELIADGVHVDPAAAKLLIAAKGPDRAILVSDAISATGMPDGEYPLGPISVKVKGGVCRDTAGNLAGSTLTLDRALRNVVAWGVPLEHALRMLTVNPAGLLGIEARKGTLTEGADADLVFLTPELQVAGVMTRGLLSEGFPA